MITAKGLWRGKILLCSDAKKVTKRDRNKRQRNEAIKKMSERKVPE